MKKSKFLLLPILAGIQLALATEPNHHEDSPSGSLSTNSSESSSTSTADATAESVSNSDSQSSASASSGDSTSISRSGDSSSSVSVVHKQRRQAPGVYTAATNTTAACQGEWHVGASVGLGGVSFGKSRTLRDCVLAQAAEYEESRGNLEASRKLRCRISFYEEALGEDCEALLNTQDGSGKTQEEVFFRTPEQRKADREKLLKEVSK
jgi:hypothetical protein